MSDVRCKFKCQEASKQIGWGGNEFLYSYRFSPVTGDSEENKKFYAATPAGEFKVSSVKQDFFKVGQEYYIDFTEA